MLSSQVTVAHSNLASLVLSVDFIHLKSTSDRENTKKLSQHQRIQDCKLFRLGSESKNESSIDPNTVVLNYLQRLITDKEKEILSKGLNFAIPFNSLHYCAFLSPFEMLFKRLKNEHVHEKSRFFPASVKVKLKGIALSRYRSYSRPNFLFSKDEIKTLDGLKDDDSIVIVKPDQGNGIVILNRSDCNKKMEDIPKDKTKFLRLDDDPEVDFTAQKQTDLVTQNLKEVGIDLRGDIRPTTSHRLPDHYIIWTSENPQGQYTIKAYFVMYK